MDDELGTVTLAVIAGGLGTRMGKPKALLEVAGLPILSWMLARLDWPGPTMLVSAPAVANPLGAQQFDQHFVDPIDGLGPLRGVLTALEQATTPMIIALAVDMPLIEKNHLRWFHDMLVARPAAFALMGKSDSHIEPFPAAYRTSAKNVVRSHLTSGQLSLHRLCKDSQFVSLPCPADWNPKAWTNLNDPAQFSAFGSGMAI